MSSDVRALASDLLTGNEAAQAAAAEALARLGEDAQPATVALVRGCASPDASVREWCVAALEELGAPPVTQLADLVLLAKSDRTDVAYWAVTLLGRAYGEPETLTKGEPEASATGDSPGANASGSQSVGANASGSQSVGANASGSPGLEFAVATLGQVLSEHAESSVRQRAAWSLGKIGPAATPALPSLHAAANDDDPRLRRLAQEAIKAIGD